MKERIEKVKKKKGKMHNKCSFCKRKEPKKYFCQEGSYFLIAAWGLSGGIPAECGDFNTTFNINSKC